MCTFLLIKCFLSRLKYFYPYCCYLSQTHGTIKVGKDLPDNLVQPLTEYSHDNENSSNYHVLLFLVKQYLTFFTKCTENKCINKLVKVAATE